MNLLRFIKKTWSFDYRSLALYRFLIGFIIMADVCYRWPDLLDFYTDVGLVPRALFTGEMSMPWSFSLHLANGSLSFTYLMFGLQCLFGLMVVLGYKTRWAVFFSYILNVSVHNRNWLINNGGDDILRSILFISIFLPLNKCFSFDSALEEKKEVKNNSNDHYSSWGLTFFLQVFVIYFVGYLLKDHPIWRTEFTGVYYASRLDIFATPLGVWLRNFSFFQLLTSIFTIYLEWLGPLFLVFAFLLGRFWWIGRIATIFLFWFLHVGIILTMWIGVFPYTCLVMWSIFIPGPFWDKLMSSIRLRFGSLRIYYDQECNFCRKAVLLFREFFLLPETKILPAQSSPEILSLMKKHNSWVVKNSQDVKFYQYDAFIELVRNSPLLKILRSFFELSFIKIIGSSCYKWISNHRGEVSKISQFFPLKTPRKKILTLGLVYQLSGMIVFISLLMWNVATVKRWGIKSPFFQSIARSLHLYQEWNMFAPYPKMDNVWIEVVAKLSDGSEIELLTEDKDVYSIKTQKFYKMVPNEHWRKFYLNLSERNDYARYFGGFLCRKWNDRGIKLVKNTTIRTMDISSFSQPNLLNGDTGGVTRKLSWTHWCFDEDLKKEKEKGTKQ